MLMNWGEDLHPFEQIVAMKDIFAELNHHYYPCRFVSTDDRNEVAIPIYWVNKKNEVRNNEGELLFESPFDFMAFPDTIAVAYPYVPNFSKSMHIYINDSHFFSLKKLKGAKYLIGAILHEALHAVAGLDHSKVPGDIMNEYYDENNWITLDTIKGIQASHLADRLAALETDISASFLLNDMQKSMALQSNRVYVKFSTIMFTFLVTILIFFLILLW